MKIFKKNILLLNIRLHFRQGDDGSIGPIGSTRMPDAVTHHTCIKTSTDYELGLILKEIRVITDQVSDLVTTSKVSSTLFIIHILKFFHIYFIN